MSLKRSLEIYLNEGVTEDDTLHSIRLALLKAGRGRVQTVFRRALMVGIQEMLLRGELPADILPPDLEATIVRTARPSTSRNTPTRRRRSRSVQTHGSEAVEGGDVQAERFSQQSPAVAPSPTPVASEPSVHTPPTDPLASARSKFAGLM